MEGIGRHIDDFKFLNKLGSGAFGEVYEAKCLNEGFKGRKVAIKKISKKSSKDERKIKREIKLHPKPTNYSFIQLYTYFEDENYFYLVLELCDGGSLEKYLEKRKKLSEDKACSIIKQVIVAVDCLHERYEIIHRDLSLRNILLKTEPEAENYQVKIADFGLACKLTDGKVSERVGTLDFMAPEVYKRKPYDFKCDWWSVGCILFALLYGNPPFKQKEIKKGNYRLLFPSHASEEAKELLTDLLKENPAERIDNQNRALKYEFFQKYKLSEDSGLNSYSSHGSINSASSKRTPRNENNNSNYDSSHLESSKRSYYEKSRVDKSNDLEYAKPKVLSDNLVRSNSKRILSSDLSNRNKSDLGSAYKSKVEALPSKNESYDEVFSEQGRRVRLCKSPSHVNDFIENDRRENPRFVNQSQTKIQTSTSSKTSYDRSLSNQMNYDSKYDINQSNQRHTLHYNDGLNRFESQYDPSIRLCPKSYPHPSEMQKNITEQNWKANSHDSGHCASNENMHFDNTHRFQASVERNSSHSDNQCYTPDVENKMKTKALDRISIVRLKNCRKKFNNFVLSIFDNDDGKKQLCLEIFKRYEEKKLLSVAFFFSHDGREITVFKPKKKIMVSDKPPSVNLKTKKSKQEVETFTLENLPEMYWKKYQIAKDFVDMIKALTPKVIFYKEFGKCIMMENTPNPNFQMHYYDGYKITESNGKITIKDETGNDVTKKGNHKNMLNNFEKMKRTCIIVENCLETNVEPLVFPIQMGSSNGKLKSQDSNKENSSVTTMQSSLMSGGLALKSFDLTLNTDSSTSQFSCLKNQSTPISSERSNTSCNRILKAMQNLKPGQLEVIQNLIQNMNEHTNT